MPSRHSTVPNLDLSSFALQATAKISSPLTPGAQSSDGASPLTPRSPKSSSSSPFFKGATIRPVTEGSHSKSSSPTFSLTPGHIAEPPTPGLTAIPPYPPSPRDSPRHNREPSRSFFASLKAPKSSHRAQRSDGSEPFGDEPKSRGSSRDRRTKIASKLYESTPDLLGTLERAAHKETNRDSTEDKDLQSQEAKKAGSDLEHGNSSKKNKPRFANLLSRSRSIRLDDSALNRRANRRPSATLMKLEGSHKREVEVPVKTPSSRSDRHAKTTGSPAVRTHPVDRPAEPGSVPIRKERSHGGSMVPSTSLSQVSGASAALFNNIKQSSSGAADRIGKAGKGFFGKITRSGSTNERELLNDDNYVCSVINLPLIEQARRTRIAKKIEDCRDKTEFWMPALPYRCIDYLNYKGCEEEGLYRVPGSGKEVKHWQRRFDTEFDINLFDEPDLYDINTIGSMFKAWLRELPDELFPKETQAMIAEKCEGATTAPQLLKDELSKLPPYNYYLLFAITCHLNLLHSYVDQNKMDYRNLCICFQPCMKIDAFCFHFLVCDWKNCWQGCWTEKEYLQREKEMDEKEKSSKAEATHSIPLNSSTVHERAISSSSSSQASAEEEQPPRPETAKSRKHRPKKIETSHTRSVSQLPELGPPLSPIQI
ncbi:putative Rho GTPase activator (Bem2) [Aspergillus clavatus NRRL 1]|uniref:Rho GTPase activator (Bem2), putative n=1 Tax=Aspergillus clavatus (strain ATCC 1007 / CBS 513.65 / DSM 816 / NCTC 3887 / NRRL 1 / QM 1276 / 107) TaxID=344612 RepID=A1CDD1_ASPCL|nr:Rho GTPase activator (Bem2), putative [Aspergillus clavatus NRRL 1]EAW11858.1 Rho GTPase activator (Bem2), putative [Aspergillus clavatus NRRL 1]